MANNTGLRIRLKSTAEMTLNTDTPITRLVHSFDTGIVEGSYTIPANVPGSKFFVYTTQSYLGDYRGPTVELNGRTITWKWGAVGGTFAKQAATVYVGSYL